MKKLYAILFIFIFCLSLFSCSKINDAHKHTVLLMGNYDENLGLKAEIYEDSGKSYIDKSAKKETKVNVLGSTVTAEYTESYKTNFYDPYETQIYKNNKSKINEKLFINSKTKQLIGYSNIPKNSTEEDKKADVSEAYCREIADNTIKDYINLSEYCKKEVVKTYHSVDIYDYSYIYVRQINGIDTADRAEVVISPKGSLLYFKLYMINEFKDLDVPEINSKNCEESIGLKLKELFKDNKNSLKDYSINNYMLIKQEDGTLALYYTIEVTLLNNNNAEFTSLLNLIVLI